MLKGVDISNWQGGLNLFNLDVDFAIMKATEGLNFVDSYCDNWVNQAKEKGIKWGFYHYANNNNPYDEAHFFIDNTRNYFNEGIPILDIEDASIMNWGDYADAFCHEVRDITGVAPMVYCSASQLFRFAGYSLVDFCGLWVAGYPYPYEWWPDEECPYSPYPWNFGAIWQFSSSLRIEGYSGNLDGNYAYMDYEAWDKYAKANTPNPQPIPQPKPNPTKSIADLAQEVIYGEYGNGDDRVNMLESQGYNYNDVQNYVNELYDVAYQVIRGDYGNGQDRIDRLANAGYNPNVVQYIVNEILA